MNLFNVICPAVDKKLIFLAPLLIWFAWTPPLLLSSEDMLKFSVVNITGKGYLLNTANLKICFVCVLHVEVHFKLPWLRKPFRTAPLTIGGALPWICDTSAMQLPFTVCYNLVEIRAWLSTSYWAWDHYSRFVVLSSLSISPSPLFFFFFSDISFTMCVLFHV